jgi:hypothetical protein
LALQDGGCTINPLQAHARLRRWHLLSPKLPQIFGDRAFPFRWHELASARCPSSYHERKRFQRENMIIFL